MRHVNRLLKSFALGLLVAAAACASDDDLVTPTPNPTPTVTETFTGTLNKNGAVTEAFSGSRADRITATYTKLEPDATVIIGLSLGTWNGTSCATVVSDDKATQGTTVVADASGSGRFCVRMYDAAGTLTEPVTYEVTVVHP